MNQQKRPSSDGCKQHDDNHTTNECDHKIISKRKDKEKGKEKIRMWLQNELHLFQMDSMILI